jgi:hypothetical protein
MKDEIIIINAYLNNLNKINLLKECIKQLRKTGIEIMLVSHSHIPEEIKPLVDYYLFDKNNTMITEWGDYWWWDNGHIHFRMRSLFAKHSHAALTSLKNGVYFAKSLDKSFFHHIEYDTILSDKDIEKLKSLRYNLDNKMGFFDYYKMSDLNHGISMLYFCSYVDNFLNDMDIPSDKSIFLEWAHNYVGAVSSEMFLYAKLKDVLGNYYLGKRVGISISIFDDNESKIAISDSIVGNEFNHFFDITYEKNNRENLYVVFFNNTPNTCLFSYYEKSISLCGNCLHYDTFDKSNEFFEYEVIDINTGHKTIRNIDVIKLLGNKMNDEFIEFR